MQLKVVTAQDSAEGIKKVLDGEYDIKDLKVEAPVILDIGANIGAFAVWANDRFPNATIFCYEPNPGTFADLKKNIEGLDNIRARKVGISNFDGKAPLFLGQHNRGECSLKSVGEQDTSRAGVARFTHASRLPPADIIKIDTEGSEVEVLEAYTHWAEVSAVVLEWHGQADRDRIRGFLGARSFFLLEDKESHYTRGVQKWVRKHYPMLALGILAGGGKSWEAFRQSLDGLKELAPNQGVGLRVFVESGTGVDRARNNLIARARKAGGCTHFMFLDDDIVFDPQWVINMVKCNLDIVAGAYPRKQINWDMVHAAVQRGVPADKLALHSTDWIINTAGEDGHHFEAFGDFMPVEEAGTGFLMFKMSVVEDLIKKHGNDMAYVSDYPPVGEIHHMLFACQRDPACEREQALTELKLAALIDDREVPQTLINAAERYYQACLDKKTVGRYLTEDYAFCRLARMAGYKIYVYLDAALKHLGTACYEGAIREYFKPEEIRTNQ